jgi:septal ring factor EnvC (AmiA/AmiB activator)
MGAPLGREFMSVPPPPRIDVARLEEAIGDLKRKLADMGLTNKPLERKLARLEAAKKKYEADMLERLRTMAQNMGFE